MNQNEFKKHIVSAAWTFLTVAILTIAQQLPLLGIESFGAMTWKVTVVTLLGVALRAGIKAVGSNFITS